MQSKCLNFIISIKNRAVKSLTQKQDLNIDEGINDFLNKDLLEKLNLIISKSKQFMRISHQKKLTKEIVLDSINTIKFPKNLISKDELFPIEEDNDKQYININEYLNEPIIEKPLNTMVFYHWFCIDGFSPKTSVNKLDNKKMVINNHPYKNDMSNINNKLIKDNHDLIIKLTKNISKELVSFAINFEKIFQEAIKDEFIMKSNEINFDIKKDIEINATIIKTEPEIVQLFPYLLAFLEENIKNKEIMKIPKMQYIILYHIKAISVNKYFDLITYMNNILELLMTLLLYSNNINDINIKDSIKVKNEIISFMINLMKNDFSKYIPDLVYSISHFIIPMNNSYPNLFRALSAIKFINSFGYDYVINYIYPQIIQIKLYFDQPVIFKYKNKIIFAEKNKPQNQIQNNNQINNVINQSNQNSQSQSSIPLKNFSVPFSNDFAIPMSVSNFAGESLMQSFWPNNNSINEKIYFRISDIDEENEKLCQENLISFFYIEIFRTIEIVVNGMKNKNVNEEQFEQCKNELNQIFGENLVNLFFDRDNINLY